MPATANRLTVVHRLASTLSPEELEQLKLERLRELRHTIDALRGERIEAIPGERESRDPLLAWAISEERKSQEP